MEVWKDVIGYEGIYSASSLGRMKSLARRGYKGRILKEKIMRQHLSGRYYMVTLNKKGRGRAKCVHRIILETFKGPCPWGMEACHGVLGSLDNRIDNLRWGTRRSNQADRKLHGTNIGPRGQKHWNNKLKDAQVLDIRKALKEGVKPKLLAAIFGVSVKTVSDIKVLRSWKHI